MCACKTCAGLFSLTLFLLLPFSIPCQSASFAENREAIKRSAYLAAQNYDPESIPESKASQILKAHLGKPLSFRDKWLPPSLLRRFLKNNNINRDKDNNRNKQSLSKRLSSRPIELPGAPHYIVLVKEDEPFVFRDSSQSGNAMFYGYSIDLLQELSTRMKFTYTLEDYDNGLTFADLITFVENGTADMSISSITITSARMERVAFPSGFLQLSMRIVVAPEQPLPDPFFMLKIFDLQVWITLICVSAFVVISFFLFEWSSKRHKKKNKGKDSSSSSDSDSTDSSSVSDIYEHDVYKEAGQKNLNTGSTTTTYNQYGGAMYVDPLDPRNIIQQSNTGDTLSMIQQRDVATVQVRQAILTTEAAISTAAVRTRGTEEVAAANATGPSPNLSGEDGLGDAAGLREAGLDYIQHNMATRATQGLALDSDHVPNMTLDMTNTPRNELALSRGNLDSIQQVMTSKAKDAMGLAGADVDAMKADMTNSAREALGLGHGSLDMIRQDMTQKARDATRLALGSLDTLEQDMTNKAKETIDIADDNIEAMKVDLTNSSPKEALELYQGSLDIIQQSINNKAKDTMSLSDNDIGPMTNKAKEALGLGEGSLDTLQQDMTNKTREAMGFADNDIEAMKANMTNKAREALGLGEGSLDTLQQDMTNKTREAIGLADDDIEAMKAEMTSKAREALGLGEGSLENMQQDISNKVRGKMGRLFNFPEAGATNGDPQAQKYGLGGLNMDSFVNRSAGKDKNGALQNEKKGGIFGGYGGKTDTSPAHAKPKDASTDLKDGPKQKKSFSADLKESMGKVKNFKSFKKELGGVFQRNFNEEHLGKFMQIKDKMSVSSPTTSFPSKLMMISVLFILVPILYAMYTANSAAFFTLDDFNLGIVDYNQDGLITVKDLPPYTESFCILENSFNFDWFVAKTEPLYQRADGGPIQYKGCKTTMECFRRVSEGDCAGTVYDGVGARYINDAYFPKNKLVGEPLNYVQYGIAMNYNNPYVGMFSEAIVALQIEGFTKGLSRKWIPNDEGDALMIVKDPEGVDYKKLTIVYIVLGVGIGLSWIVFFGIMIQRHMARREKKDEDDSEQSGSWFSKLSRT